MTSKYRLVWIFHVLRFRRVETCFFVQEKDKVWVKTLSINPSFPKCSTICRYNKMDGINVNFPQNVPLFCCMHSFSSSFLRSSIRQDQISSLCIPCLLSVPLIRLLLNTRASVSHIPQSGFGAIFGPGRYLTMLIGCIYII